VRRFAPHLLSVLIVFLLSGCPDCGPGWTITWDDASWAVAPSGEQPWVETRGVRVDVPGMPHESWANAFEWTIDGARVQVYEYHATWTFAVLTDDEAIARATARQVLAELVGERADGLAASLAAMEGGCDRGRCWWTVDFDDPVVPDSWFDTGRLESQSPGQYSWIGPTTVRFSIPSYEWRGSADGQAIIIRGDATGAVRATVYQTSSGAEPISRDLALDLLEAALGRAVPDDVLAKAGSCYTLQ